MLPEYGISLLHPLSSSPPSPPRWGETRLRFPDAAAVPFRIIPRIKRRRRRTDGEIPPRVQRDRETDGRAKEMLGEGGGLVQGGRITYPIWKRWPARCTLKIGRRSPRRGMQQPEFAGS